MKKFIAMLLALVMVMGLVACGAKEEAAAPAATEAATEAAPAAPEEGMLDGGADVAVEVEPEVAVMTYEEFLAADLDSEVVIETYVQAHQSWWDNKITVYCQDEVGAYFLYELACSEEDAANLVPGTKIRVTGYKGEWAGEVEIMDGTFEFVEADAMYIGATDYTDLLGTDEMAAHQNELAAFTGMTVEAIDYKNGEPGDDIYLTLSKDGASYNFCVEVYLTGPDSEVYTTVGELAVGDVVNVEGYLYWYEGMNPHVTSIVVAE